jgi:hypothetical protein
LHPSPPPPAEPTPQILRPASDPAEIAVPANSAPCRDPAEIADPPRKKPLFDPADSADESTKKESTKDSTKGKRADARETEHPQFREFYAAYPRKDTGPKPVIAAFNRAIRDGATADQIIEGLARYRFNDDPHYRPQATTWLHQQRWMAQQPSGEREEIGKLDTIRRDWNLPTFLTPILDDEPVPSLLIEAVP